MNKKLLIIGFVWPEPKSSAAGSRMMQLIEAFQIKNYQIIFASTAVRNEHAFNLSALGIEQVSIEMNNTSFDDFILDLKPDMVLFDRFMTEEQFGWRVAEHCPNALRILDTEDLHSLRKVRQECFKKHEDFSIDAWLKADITKREIASIYRSDLTLIISEYEMERLQDTLKMDRGLLHYLPFMLDVVTEAEKKVLPIFEKRQHFITIGNFRHEPNYDAVLYLKETIWPTIKKALPLTEMHVYGSYPSQKVKQLNTPKDHFFIKGWAEDAKDVMQQAKVCLSPLRFGAGLKGKFVEAMQCGTPSVTTSIGAEGLDDNFGGFISDNPKDIAQHAIALYTKENLWLRKQQDGFKLLEGFNKEELQIEFLNRVELTLEKRDALRLQNFTGALLNYHTMQSTKYMSKWIEEKHKEI